MITIRDRLDINTGAELPQPRGFRLQTVGGRAYFVRLGYVAEQCEGDAHSNPMIDNCGVCLSGRWGVSVRKRPALAAAPPRRVK